MPTVKNLIEQLQSHDPDLPIVFQYLVSGHPDFKGVSEYLANNDQFGQDTSDLFTAWITEAEDVLASIEEQGE